MCTHIYIYTGNDMSQHISFPNIFQQLSAIVVVCVICLSFVWNQDGLVSVVFLGPLLTKLCVGSESQLTWSFSHKFQTSVLGNGLRAKLLQDGLG